MIAIVDYGMGNLRSVQKGFEHMSVALSAVVQLMVFSKAAGVMFTLNVSNGNRDEVVAFVERHVARPEDGSAHVGDEGQAGSGGEGGA